VKAGGLQVVEPAGLASGTVVSSGAEMPVASGGTASGAILSSGRFDEVFGAAVSTTINGAEVDFGVTSATKVNSGGVQFVKSNALTIGAVVMTGGAQTVDAGVRRHEMTRCANCVLTRCSKTRT
jgi:autotransporter passenger strand-loop-strand repeat protein